MFPPGRLLPPLLSESECPCHTPRARPGVSSVSEPGTPQATLTLTRRQGEEGALTPRLPPELWDLVSCSETPLSRC